MKHRPAAKSAQLAGVSSKGEFLASQGPGKGVKSTPLFKRKSRACEKIHKVLATIPNALFYRPSFA
jgi:hypothetical protein